MDASTLATTSVTTDDAKRTTIVIEIDCEFKGDLSSLTGLVDMMKPVTEAAKKLGDVKSFAKIGRLRIPVA